MADEDCCMARHANATPPWTCDCPCHERNVNGESVECPVFHPDHNGECLNCDEWMDAHSPEAIAVGEALSEKRKNGRP